MLCSISEHSVYKTIPTKLLKLVLTSKSINELQKPYQHLTDFLPSAPPDHIKGIYHYSNHIFLSSHTQATIEIYQIILLNLKALFSSSHIGRNTLINLNISTQR